MGAVLTIVDRDARRSASREDNSLPPIVEQPPRVLLVDGASALAERVARGLEGSGCELVVHKSVRGLVEAVSAYAPDVILIDVLADESGFTLCGELRASAAARQLPIVLLASGAADEPMITRGLLCGADDFVCVTDRLVEFQARVRVQLRHKRERDRLHRVRAERDNFRREASLDALTGLPNRRALDASIDEAWSLGRAFAIVFIDVDDFKSVNDTFGHEAGDRVLKRVAGSLASSLREIDRCGRWGGEEFVAVLSGVSSDDAHRIADHARRRIAEQCANEIEGRRVTVSIGVALFDPTAPDGNPEALCQRADHALYEAKRQGKNRVVVSRPVHVRAGHVSLRAGATSIAPHVDTRTALEAALVKELSTGRAGLPVLPEAAQQALHLAEDPRTDMVKIGKLIDRDPPLAARFVAVAGSALYARGMKPVSTHSALVRIGLATSRDLLLQIAYERNNLELPLFRAEVARSFKRSVAAGIAARMLAAELRVTLDSAYLCGLLHDIGESRIYRILAQMPAALEVPDFVPELVARHHQRAGADVARAWHLSSEIVEACGHHHGGPSASLPIRIVMGADALVGMIENTAPDATFDGELAVLRNCGLTDERGVDLAYRVRAAVVDAEGNPNASPSARPRADLDVRERRAPGARPSLLGMAAASSSRFPQRPSLMNVRIRSR